MTLKSNLHLVLSEQCHALQETQLSFLPQVVTAGKDLGDTYMPKTSNSAEFSMIGAKIEEARIVLQQLGYNSERISPREFCDYMTGETPTGDTITLNDVLRNGFFMVHEVVEISELKKKGILINKETVMSFYPQVYEAHFTAMDHELTYALRKRDYEWLERRFVSPEAFMSHLDDPYLPPEFDYLRQKLATQCESIVKKFSGHLRKAQKNSS